MMKPFLTIAVLLTIISIAACTKDSNPVHDTTPQTMTAKPSDNQFGNLAATQARLSGTNYSKSISLDTANRMLASYLNSVGYPAVDTAVRSLSFDADTLRSYLQNPEIVTLKFMLAHQPDYINSGRNGKTAGTKAGALTLIIVGLDNNEQTVLNNKGGVYDNFSMCPIFCPSDVNDAYIH